MSEQEQSIGAYFRAVRAAVGALRGEAAQRGYHRPVVMGLLVAGPLILS